jgi:hypothetical protein
MGIKLIGIAFLACFCVPLSAGHAQTKSRKPTRPDLSGVWTADQTKNRNNRFPEPFEISLIVSQREPVITMRRKFNLDGKEQEQELIYFTDQRGEVNLTLRGSKSKSESRTRWEGDRLVIRYDSYSASVSGSAVEALTEVNWKLSSDGEVLTKRSTTTYRAGTTVDSSVSAMDRRKPTMVLPTLVFEQAYKKVH